jgi:hypothetical protein
VDEPHRHLFTPQHWCLMPYMAQFGVTQNDVEESSGAIKGYLFDQYVRACGFTPVDAWVFVVLPSGDCEFTPLAPDEKHWCCEQRAEISARVGLPTVGSPPWASPEHLDTEKGADHEHRSDTVRGRT